jgi:mono/diheme cytochrome c family protein
MLATVDRALMWVTWAVAAVAVVLLLVGPRVVAHDSSKASAAGSPYAGGALQDFKANCGSCHTLSAAGTTGAVGPKLDGLHLTAAQVLAAMRAGPGAMPAFGGKLSPAQLSALGAFVAQASG